MMVTKLLRALPVAMVYGLLSCPLPTFACDIDAVNKNIGWLQDNNSDAYGKIVTGCKKLNGTPESGTALTIIQDAFKTGQSRNPGAASAIDGCADADILEKVCGNLN
jgi:hypothetical protein